MYLLDSNTCIGYLRKSSASLVNKISNTPFAELVVCSVVKAELFYGSMKSNNPTKSLAIQKTFVNQFQSFPFDDKAAEIYGDIRAQLQKAGTPIGGNDFMIAAIALANDLTLVTHNVKEFSRVKGLKIEDWQATP
jgi:tRNA(fMet)-specific endonuclease VapC